MTGVELPGAASTTRSDHDAWPRSAPGQPRLRRMSSKLRHTSHRESGKPDFETEAIAQGQVPSRRLLQVGRGPAPDDIAGWLGVLAGELVMIRKRLQLLNGAPAAISSSYLPLWVASGTRLEST